MKTGKTLVELATELQRQVATRRDFIAPTDKLTAEAVDGKALLAGLLDRPLTLTDHAHGQVAGELGIHKTYYDKMVAEAPDLWATNVNHWLRAQPKNRLVRTLDYRVRGFLSDSYRPLDNYDLTEAIVQAIGSMDGEARVESCEATEKRLYIKLVRPTVQWDAAMAKREAMLQAGESVHQFLTEDVLQAAVTIRNSEVGAGALAVEHGVFRLACYNLATTERAYRKTHVGRKHGNGNNGHGDEDVYQLLSDEARAADDKALWLRVRDVVRHALSEEQFMASAKKFAGAAGDRLGANVEKAVEVTAVKFGFTDATRQGVLRHLIEGGDLSRLGLVNAVTRQSQDEKDYDTATDMERLGGKLLELPAAEWRALAEAK